MKFSFKKTALIGLSISLFAANSAFAATIGTITGDGVNLRDSNSTDSSVITTLSSGAQLSVLEDMDGWFKVASPKGGVAYVTSDYLKITQSDATVNSSGVNIRTEPSSDADVIGQLSQGESLNVQGMTGDWYIILYNGVNAYVNKEYVSGELLKYLPATAMELKAPESDVYGVVNADGLNLRTDATLDAEVIKQLSNGTTVDVIGVSSDWAKIRDNTGATGYVSTAYLVLQNGQKPAASSGKGAQIVAFAKQFIGTPYVYGGTSLTSGVDCSGFIYSVYKNFGITLNRTSRDQIKNGVAVSKNNLQPGDLVFFNTGGNTPISHVGMYIGNGQYIHSTDGGNKGVTITNLNSGYSANTYYGACRVLND